MKPFQLILVILLCVAASLGAVRFWGVAPAGKGSMRIAGESAYDRVRRTGTLRCGYLFYPKMVERDLHTGKLSGFMYEILEEIGRQLSLKIEWTEEVGLASAFDGLRAARYDVMCVPFNQTPNRALATEFTEPIIYFPSFVYARADDKRFDNAYEKINDPAVRVALLDGELGQIIRKEQFPKTQPVSLPDLTDFSQVMLQVALNKADVVITEPSSAEPFLTANPGKLKRVPGLPLRVEGAGLNVAVGEHELKSLLNTTIKGLHTIGYVERLMNKYTTATGQYYFPAKPWGESSEPLKERDK